MRLLHPIFLRPSVWLADSTISPSLMAHAMRIVGLAAALLSTPAVMAAEPADFEAALTKALSPWYVVNSGTVFDEPLISRGNAVENLASRTPQVMQRVAKLIEGAQHEILLQTYEWHDDDEAAQAVLGALQKRVDKALMAPRLDTAPFRFRILTSQSWLSENKLSQAALRAFIQSLGANPAAKGRVAADWATYRGSPMAILHSKTVVVDNHRAAVMTGNLYTHGGLAQDSVNMATVLTGQVAAGLRSDWHNARAQATLEESSEPLGQSAYAFEQLEPNGDGESFSAILSRPSHWSYFTDGALSPQAQGLQTLIHTATESIDILNPSLGVPALNKALVQAMVERGVRVRAVVSLWMNRQREHRYFGGDNAEQAYRLYAELLRRGGRTAADRFTIAFASLDGTVPSQPSTPGNIHAKVASFDQSCILIGSTNWNWLSWNNGRELSVVSGAPDVARDFSQHLFAEILATAVPFDVKHIADWSHEPHDKVAQYLATRSNSAW